jgi:hypothetical protein
MASDGKHAMTQPLSPSRIRRRLASALLALSVLPAAAEGDVARGVAIGLGVIAPTPRIAALTTPLAPLPRPPAPLEADIAATALRDGRAFTLTVEDRRGAAVRVRQSDGCAWSREGDWFTPAHGWSGCGDSDGWHDGAAQVRALASIWPLTVGAEGRWTRLAVSAAGVRYARDTACRVQAAEAVIRDGRDPTPAFKVVCDDGGRRTLTTWYAPGEGPVAFVQRDAEGRIEQAWVRS